MALTFTDTHNMIAFLTKSNASEGFEQIIDFWNANVIKYALMVNPTIYVSCIKKFWTSVSIKKSNDVVRLQSLIDRKKRMKMMLMNFQPTPPLPTPATLPPPPQPEHIPSPPQAETTQLSPPPQQQPLHNAKISMTLLNQLLEICATLTKQVANLEQDKVAQAIKITKLKQRVRRLEKKRQSKSLGLKRLKKDVTLETVDDDVQGRLEESQAKVYHLDLEHADKVLSMQETDKAEPAKVEEVIKVVTVVKLMTKVVTTATTTITVALVPKASAPRRRRGVIIQDPKEAATASVIVQLEVKSKDKDQVKRKERQDNTVMRYQALKRKPITKAHARKNMMVYLKNMAGFKMDFFRGITYTEISPIFEKHYNSIQAFLEKGEKEIEEAGSKRKIESSKQKAAKKQKIDEEIEELRTHLQIVPNDEDDVYTEATPLTLKVSVIDYQIYHEHNKPFYKIIRADETHQLFLSFITLSRNFDREDLEMLWKLVQEKFQSSEPKNFLDDFLLNTLKTMFEKPNVEASIWRDQRGRYGLAKFKSWKLIESCREQLEEEVRETIMKTMEQYMSKTRGDYGSGVTRPTINQDTHFKLKRKFLKERRDNTFSGLEHEDANEHIEKVLKIVDLFHIPKITQDQFMLRAFPGAIPSKTAADAKVAIQEMVEFSQKWHNGTSLRSRSTKTSDGLAAIQDQLNNLGREIKNVNEKVYAAQFGCELCKVPHYTKYYPQKEKGKTLEEALLYTVRYTLST
uniref:Uncharacterized protein n=1 Tax=Tanacetum cinerariifolium TaxID=118510 RepID=A0A6L2NFV8_TANCI|nr:hypothetical protein [Tanacetum cinerariifolium]